MKATQETYTEKEKQFKEESQKKLEERLKVYDQRIIEITKNQSPTKIITQEQQQQSNETETSVAAGGSTSATKGESKKEEKDCGQGDEAVDNMEEQYGEDDLINEIYNMN